jgi:two-component system phosphate regulon sensor histidine kinase PhoR
VVDDSPTDARRVSKLFANEYDVRVMHDGSAALEQLASGSYPDLLVLDWVMPGISGIEVCEYLRKGSVPHRVPILLLTARHGTQEILQAFKSGANDYVSKPFVDEELKARAFSLLENRRLLERAEQAEADARSLLARAPDPIFAVDAQGAVTYVNEEALRTLKRSADGIVGTRLSALLPGLSVRNIAVAPGESLLPLPDIQIADRVYSPSVRILPSDSAATTTIALRDVTERRAAEARRLDFYSMIAHDLRSPISAVLLRLDRAFRGRHGVLPAGHLVDLRKIEANLRSLVGMINEFLELARLEGIGYKIDRDPVQLNELFRAIMDDFRPVLESNDLTWQPIGFESRATVRGDAQRLAQVLTNLISNAIKFTPRGGSITTTLIVTDDYVEAAVEDTGRGIAREELPTVFERFTRARGVSGEVVGTGLGLMIVREVVQAHGGVVGVESELGVGSRFWFRLPKDLSAANGV